MVDTAQSEPVADAAMDAKMREIYAAFDKPWIRRRLQSLLPPAPVEWAGCRFVVHPRDNFTEFKLWETGAPPEAAATEALAARFRGQDIVVVDVGANAGVFSLPILKAARRVQAHLFEPNPVMRARLEANVALNALSDVQIHDCAVGAATGNVGLHLPGNGNLGQARIVEAYGADLPVIEVPMRPLAEVMQEAGVAAIDLLKVDVEGFEDQVICPYLADRDAPKPRLIYFEIAHDGTWTRPLKADLVLYGYRQIDTFGPNALFALEDGL